ncbi:MAG TPA: TIM barrel protein [Verrucomicrobiales bacterium]|nr:TIM barrel protein [Verrucomicrobiales bacterium]
MKLGIGSYTYTWAVGIPGHAPVRPITAFDLLEEARRLEVRLIQICDNLPFAQLPESDLDAFETALHKSRIALELGTRGLDESNLLRHLDLALRFHSPFLRLVIDSPGDEPSPEEAVRRLQAVLPAFHRAGVKIAIENHDRFPSAVLASMIQELGAGRAGICLDTVNSFGAAEGPDLVLSHLAPFTLCVHIKDFTIRRPEHQLGFLVEGCAAGSGMLDIPGLLIRTSASPHPWNVILETWVTPMQTLEETIALERAWAEEGVRFLRTLIPS